MHFGETLPEDRFLGCIKTAYEAGIRTFVTSDVYGNGKADTLLGQALAGIDRSTYALVGMIGHDFYDGERKGSQGYPRFTDPELRGTDGYDEFVQRATKLSLERCGTDHFDLLMLHNPDEHGYTSEAVWNAMARAKETGLTRELGMAPGPANGFTLDLLAFFEKFGGIIDWTMLILNPLEPWPSNLLLPACEKHGIKVLTRVVDYNLSLIEFACIWNLSQAPVECVVPTFIQEAGASARLIEDKIREFGKMPDVRLTPEEVDAVRQIGDNTGCMTLKGASQRHTTSERCDEWPMKPELLDLAQREGLGVDW